MLEGEPLSGATEPGLDLVADERHVMVPRVPGDGAQPAVGRHDDAAFALNGLQDGGGRFDHAAEGISRAVPKALAQAIRHMSGVSFNGQRKQ